jgi:Ca-activated chloride channel family protein
LGAFFSSTCGILGHHGEVERMLRRLLPRALLLTIAAACAADGLLVPAATHAQVVFRSGVDLVNFGVTVVNRRGDLVTDLTASDFEIVERGKPQTIEFFARGGETEKLPTLHLGLLFDTSGSMTDDSSFSRSAAIKFLNLLPQAEDMTLVDFDTEVRVARFSQADFPRLVERIRNRKPDGWTALYDAIGVYLDGADVMDGRKILVVYTDGGDTRSSTTFSEVTNLLKASDVTLYAIGFLDNQSPSFKNDQRMRLTQFAELTGGQAFFPSSSKQLDEMYEKVLAEISAQYTLGYQSTDKTTDGTWRQVEIKLTRPDLKGARIRTRRGYFGPALPPPDSRQ